MSPSYGHTYLTSYGWAGTGTGLRKGAIERPLAIPPKKNLNGLGKDRDEAFPFWDHLFTAASKAITIKVSSDDEDTEDPSDTDTKSAPLRRTTTGIISNRRPVSGTPASTSGSTTPSLDADAGAARLSLLATAKREAAKRGLYARFFRGPVLGPDDEASAGSPSHLAPSPFESSSSSSSTTTPVPEQVSDRQDAVGETKSKKRKSEDKAETKEERRQRKRLKKERRAARAAKRAEKALAGDKAKEMRDQLDQKARKYRDETQSEETFLKARKRACKSLAGSAGEVLEQAKCTRKTLEELASSNNGQQDTCSHRPSRNMDATNVIVTTKKKGKRKDTPS